MKTCLSVAVAAACLALMAGPSLASNTLTLTGYDSAGNSAQLGVAGDGNLLNVIQSFDGAGGGNLLDLTIEGDLNGGPLGSGFNGLANPAGLSPGSITQVGHANTISFTSTGSQNLFALSQVGSNNTLTGTVSGNNNQAIVAQIGTGNSLAFSQIGNGNMISVVQNSY